MLTAAGWGDAARAPLAGDASNRRYWRLSQADDARAVVMDAPPARGEDVRPFAALTALLRGRGLSAPEILGADPEHGFLLLEDLGDALFARAAAERPEETTTLYATAVDVLAALHAEPAPRRAPQPAVMGSALSAPAPLRLAAYDAAELAREARLFVDWWLFGLGAGPSNEAAAAFDAALADALANVVVSEETRDAGAPSGAPQVGRLIGPADGLGAALALRDYHAENLLWLPERAGLARVGLLDYQDALIGHPAYDLVSLLEDARRDVDPALAAAMIERYLAAAGLRGARAEAFRAAYAALGAQRNLKIIGIFARLALRDGKPRYLAHVPRVWAHLGRDLEDPRLSLLAAWMRRFAPPPAPEGLARLEAAAGAFAGRLFAGDAAL